MATPNTIRVLLKLDGDPSGMQGAAAVGMRVIENTANAAIKVNTQVRTNAQQTVRTLENQLDGLKRKMADFNRVKVAAPKEVDVLSLERQKLDRQLAGSVRDLSKANRDLSVSEVQVAKAATARKAAVLAVYRAEAQRRRAEVDLTKAQQALASASAVSSKARAAAAERVKRAEENLLRTQLGLPITYQRRAQAVRTLEDAERRRAAAQVAVTRAEQAAGASTRQLAKAEAELIRHQNLLNAGRTVARRVLGGLTADEKAHVAAAQRDVALLTTLTTKERDAVRALDAHRASFKGVRTAQVDYDRALTSHIALMTRRKSVDDGVKQKQKELQAATVGLTKVEKDAIAVEVKLTQAKTQSATVTAKIPPLNQKVANTQREVNRQARDGGQAFAFLSNKASGLAIHLQGASVVLGSLGMALTALSSRGRGAFAGAIESSADWEQSLVTIAAISGEAEGAIDRIRETSLQLGKDTVFTAEEATQAISLLVRNGVDLDAVLKDGAASVLTLSAATGDSIDDASKLVTQLTNIFRDTGITIEESVNYASKAINSSIMSASDFSNVLKNVGSVASTLKIPVEDLTQAAAILARYGVTAGPAGTALRYFWLNAVPRTNSAFEAMQQYGLLTLKTAKADQDLRAAQIAHTRDSEGYLQALWNLAGGVGSLSEATDLQVGKFRVWAVSQGYIQSELLTTEGTLKSFSEVLGILNGKLGDLDPASRLTALSRLFGERGGSKGAAALLDALNTVVGETTESGQDLANVVEEVNYKLGTMGDASAISDARMSGLSGALEYARGTLDSIRKTLTAPFQSPLAELLRNLDQKVLDPLLDFLSKQPQIASLVGTIGALALAVGSVAGPLIVLAAAWPYLSAGFAGLAAAAGPILLVLAGLSVVVLGVVQAISDPSSGLGSVLNILTLSLRNLTDGLAPLLEGLGAAFLEASGAAADFIVGTLLPTLTGLVDNIRWYALPLLSDLGAFLKERLPEAAAGFTDALSVLGEIAGQVWSYIVDLTSGLTRMGGQVDSIAPIVRNLVLILVAYKTATLVSVVVTGLWSKAVAIAALHQRFFGQQTLLGGLALRLYNGVKIVSIFLWGVLRNAIRLARGEMALSNASVLRGIALDKAAALAKRLLTFSVNGLKIGLKGLALAFGPIGIALMVIPNLLGLLKDAWSNNFLGIRSIVSGAVSFITERFGWLGNALGFVGDVIKTVLGVFGITFDDAASDVESDSARMQEAFGDEFTSAFKDGVDGAGEEASKLPGVLDYAEELKKAGIANAEGYLDDGIIKALDDADLSTTAEGVVDQLGTDSLKDRAAEHGTGIVTSYIEGGSPDGIVPTLSSLQPQIIDGVETYVVGPMADSGILDKTAEQGSLVVDSYIKGDGTEGVIPSLLAANTADVIPAATTTAEALGSVGVCDTAADSGGAVAGSFVNNGQGGGVTPTLVANIPTIGVVASNTVAGGFAPAIGTAVAYGSAVGGAFVAALNAALAAIPPEFRGKILTGVPSGGITQQTKDKMRKYGPPAPGTPRVLNSQTRDKLLREARGNPPAVLLPTTPKGSLPPTDSEGRYVFGPTYPVLTPAQKQALAIMQSGYSGDGGAVIPRRSKGKVDPYPGVRQPGPPAQEIIDEIVSKTEGNGNQPLGERSPVDGKGGGGSGGGGGDGSVADKEKSVAEQQAEIIKKWADAVKAGIEAVKSLVGLTIPPGAEEKARLLVEFLGRVAYMLQEKARAYIGEEGGTLLDTTSKYADTLEKGASLLLKGIEAFNTLPDAVLPAESAIRDFMRAIGWVARELIRLASEYSIDAVVGADIFADSALKGVELISKGTEGLSKLDGYAAPTEDSVRTFVDSLRTVLLLLLPLAREFGLEAQELLSTFSEAAGKVGEGTGKILSVLISLATLEAPLDRATDNIPTMVRQLGILMSSIGDFLAANPAWLDKGGRNSELVGIFAENFGKAADGVLKFFTLAQALSDPKLKLGPVVQTIKTLVLQSLIMMSELGSLLSQNRAWLDPDSQNAKKVAAFAEAFGKVADSLIKFVELAVTLSSPKLRLGPVVGTIRSLVNDAVAMMNEVGYLIGKREGNPGWNPEDAALVGAWADAAQKAIDAVVKFVGLASTAAGTKKLATGGQLNALAVAAANYIADFKRAFTLLIETSINTEGEAERNTEAVAGMADAVTGSLKNTYDLLSSLTDAEAVFKKDPAQHAGRLIDAVKRFLQAFTAPEIKAELSRLVEEAGELPALVGAAISPFSTFFDPIERLADFVEVSQGRITAFKTSTVRLLQAIPDIASTLSEEALQSAKLAGETLSPAMSMLVGAIDVFKALTGTRDEDGKVTGQFLDPDPAAITALIGKLHLTLTLFVDAIVSGFGPELREAAHKVATLLGPSIDMLRSVLDLFKGVTGDEEDKDRFLDPDDSALGALVGNLYILLGHWKNLITSGDFQGDFWDRSLEFAANISSVLTTLQATIQLANDIVKANEGGAIDSLPDLVGKLISAMRAMQASTLPTVVGGFSQFLSDTQKEFLGETNELTPGTIAHAWHGPDRKRSLLTAMLWAFNGDKQFRPEMRNAFSGLWTDLGLIYDGQVPQLQASWLNGLNQLIADVKAKLQELKTTVEGFASGTFSVSIAVNVSGEALAALPKLAGGGIATGRGAVAAILGDGREPELILPLSQAARIGFGGEGREGGAHEVHHHTHTETRIDYHIREAVIQKKVDPRETDLRQRAFNQDLS